eukprot:gene10162-23377_t
MFRDLLRSVPRRPPNDWAGDLETVVPKLMMHTTGTTLPGTPTDPGTVWFQDFAYASRGTDSDTNFTDRDKRFRLVAVCERTDVATVGSDDRMAPRRLVAFTDHIRVVQYTLAVVAEPAQNECPLR